MTVTQLAPTRRRSPLDAIERWLFSRPLWQLTVTGFAVSVVLYGYRAVFHIGLLVALARDPTLQLGYGGDYLHQSPIGPLLTHYLGASSAAGVMFISFAANLLGVTAIAYAVRHYATDMAARLFVVAFFCSPLAAMAVNHLGMFDVITYGAGTLVMVASAPVCVVAGLAMGFNHFEQSIVMLGAAAVMRGVLRKDNRAPLIAAGFGLIAGKILLGLYLAVRGIEVSESRLSLALGDPGSFFRLWRGHLPVLIFSVFNVLWLPVAVMWRDQTQRNRRVLVVTQFVATLPVLLTSDLTRVYAIVTWPIVVFTVLYWSEHPDRAMVRRWAVWLLLAAMFIPRVNINYLGDVIVSRWDRY